MQYKLHESLTFQHSKHYPCARKTCSQRSWLLAWNIETRPSGVVRSFALLLPLIILIVSCMVIYLILLISSIQKFHIPSCDINNVSQRAKPRLRFRQFCACKAAHILNYYKLPRKASPPVFSQSPSFSCSTSCIRNRWPRTFATLTQRNFFRLAER